MSIPETRRMRLLIAGGGTGGHVLPAVAVVDELRQQDQIDDLLWLGSHDGLEASAAARANIPFSAIQTGKLRRYFSLTTATDAVRFPIGAVQARRHIRRFRPTVVLSTGGFVSVPSAIAARGQAPVLTHEQTAIIGLANRINARFAAVLAVTFPPTADIARQFHRQVVVTGNPVRQAILAGDATNISNHWPVSSTPMLLYVTGGARGASPVTDRIAALLPELLDHVQIIHQTGPDQANGDASRQRAAHATWAPEHQVRYHIVEFVTDQLPDVYARADLIIGRAGAGTVTELAALGKPAILIPLPGAGGDEQTKNARMLADVGAAIVIPQDEATPARLRAEILNLVENPDRLAAMAAAARQIARTDAAARLASVLLDLHHHRPVNLDDF